MNDPGFQIFIGINCYCRGILIITTGDQIYESATCGHCEGIGCLYCNKTGVILVKAPKRQCLYCEGVGCIYCGFTGWADPKGKYD